MRAAPLLALLLVAPALAGEPPAEPQLRIEVGLHTAVVNQVAVTRDGRLLTVSDDKTARLWSGNGGATGVLRVPIGEGAEGALYAVAASPVRDAAVVGGRTGLGWDGAVSVYALDLVTGEVTGRIGGLPGTVHALAYSRDGRFLAIGTGGRAGLRVLDLTERKLAGEDTGYGDSVVSAAFLSDGRLVTASLDGQVRLYDRGLAVVAAHRLPGGQRPWRLAVSPAGDAVAVGSLDAAAVTVLAVDGLKPRAVLRGSQGQRGALSAVAWTTAGIFAAGTYGDELGTKRVVLWAGPESTRLRDGVLALDTVTDLASLPDGTIAFTTGEPSVGILDPTSLVARTWRRVFPDFRDAFEGTFALAADGLAVDFGMAQRGRRPFRFDLAERALTPGPAPRPDLEAPRVPAGTAGWRNGSAPSVGGKPVRLDENEYARSVAGSADGSRVLLGADYSLRLLEGGTTRWVRPLHAPAWAVNLSADGRLALAALGDGTLRWYSAEDGGERIALFATEDGRWIAWTPEGYFDHGPGSEGLVGYHLNRGRAGTPELVRSGQIHRTFFRPDLLTLRLRGVDLAPEVAKTGDAKAVVTSRTPPRVRLLAWCARGECKDVPPAAASPGEAPAITVDDPLLTLRVGVEGEAGDPGRVVLKRSGAAVPTRSVAVVSRHAYRVEEHALRLEPGENRVSISAFDAAGTVETGTPVQVVIRYTGAREALPSLHVVSVGINRYRSPEIPPLLNAVNDARGVAELMSRVRVSLFKEMRVTVLTDEGATLPNIRHALDEVAATAEPEDVVLLFLAGHGVVHAGRYNFLPHEVAGATLEAVTASGLGQTELAERIGALPTARTAVLIDSCYAGAFAARDAVLRQSGDRTWVGALGFNTGRYVLAGTSSEQEALDGIEGHGVFTAVVLEALRGLADREGKGNRDGRVDVVELTRYAVARVPEEAQRLAPTHAQRATGFFAGSDFFELSAAAP